MKERVVELFEHAIEAARHGARADGCAALHGRITASRQRLWFLGADDLTPEQRERISHAFSEGVYDEAMRRALVLLALRDVCALAACARATYRVMCCATEDQERWRDEVARALPFHCGVAPGEAAAAATTVRKIASANGPVARTASVAPRLLAVAQFAPFGLSYRRTLLRVLRARADAAARRRATFELGWLLRCLNEPWRPTTASEDDASSLPVVARLVELNGADVQAVREHIDPPAAPEVHEFADPQPPNRAVPAADTRAYLRAWLAVLDRERPPVAASASVSGGEG